MSSEIEWTTTRFPVNHSMMRRIEKNRSPLCFDSGAYARKDLAKNSGSTREQRLYILSQCSKCSNVLYADFRADEICFSYYRFKELGLSLKELFAFQDKVPVVYPWNSEYDTFRQDVNRRL